MDSMTLKIILLIVMAIIATVFGVLPIKVYRLLSNQTARSLANSRFSSLLITLLSCFAGGVILGVCMLDLLPSAKSDFEDLKTALNWKPHYPFVELLIGVGFFVVYLTEEIFDAVFQHHDETHHQHNSDVEQNNKETLKDAKCSDIDVKSTVSWITVSDQTSETIQSQTSTIVLMNGKRSASSERNAMVNSITFIIAFVFHTSLEGFAFGVQETAVSIASLFFGIIVHKAIVSFSVGMRLVRSHPDKPLFVFILIFLLAVTSPIGGVIGILVQDSSMKSTTKDIVSTVLTSLSIGTFLFITFFEILSPERATKHPKLLQWLATLVGFGLIAIMMLFGH